MYLVISISFASVVTNHYDYTILKHVMTLNLYFTNHFDDQRTLFDNLSRRSDLELLSCVSPIMELA